MIEELFDKDKIIERAVTRIRRSSEWQRERDAAEAALKRGETYWVVNPYPVAFMKIQVDPEKYIEALDKDKRPISRNLYLEQEYIKVGRELELLSAWPAVIYNNF